MLGVDARACVAQYATSVYTTTPLCDRADAILRALEQVEGVGTLWSPIKDMEDVSAGALPDLTAFLPLWVKRLQRFRAPKDDWEAEHERWLREGVFRADGVDGLERIARKTKRPRACLAWYEALADQSDWTAALGACDVAARMVHQSHWRGELLDGAALAAQELGRSDLGKRLEAAWGAAPTMARLLRWLAVDGDDYERIRSKATRPLARCPKAATRQIGLLRVLVGDVTGAATVLAKSPGLGWSNPDHPGHTLFPLLAMLLSNGTIGDVLVTELAATGRDPLESFAAADLAEKPKLRTPSILALIQRARPSIALTDPDRDAAIDAMRIAAEKRVRAFSATPGDSTTVTPRCSSRRAMRMRPRAVRPSSCGGANLRQQYWRRHAFREELARACERLDVFVPDSQTLTGSDAGGATVIPSSAEIRRWHR